MSLVAVIVVALALGALLGHRLAARGLPAANAHATATEASVAYLAGTTREGTSTFHELRVILRLGLRPRYARFLTPDSLAAASEPGAVLHVNERVASGATIRHAVALLDVDRIARTVLVGNPLHGRQVKRFFELEGYWTGEAIFIGTAGLTATVRRDRHPR